MSSGFNGGYKWLPTEMQKEKQYGKAKFENLKSGDYENLKIWKFWDLRDREIF